MITVLAVLGVLVGAGLITWSSVRHTRNHPRRIVQPPGWDPERTRGCITINIVGILIVMAAGSALERSGFAWWVGVLLFLPLWICGLMPIWLHNRALRRAAGQPVQTRQE